MNNPYPTLAHSRPTGHTQQNILFCSNEPNLRRVVSHSNRLPPSVLRALRAGRGVHPRTQNQTHLRCDQTRLLALVAHHLWWVPRPFDTLRVKSKRDCFGRPSFDELRMTSDTCNDETGRVNRTQFKRRSRASSRVTSLFDEERQPRRRD